MTWPHLFLALVGLILAVTAYVCAFRLRPGWVSSAGLALVLAGAFITFTGTPTDIRAQPAVGLAFFVAWIALFRLMGRFERPR
ncbi:hypothetical protein [Actinoplanes subtropicus]|uniref:hypothetical protein n=1 Tax=Actinoplanes subtropicus TaxID=543632 RepID=UPI0004C3D577|nr:hypothetical protein [Actinoplanes subtropicus]